MEKLILKDFSGGLYTVEDEELIPDRVWYIPPFLYIYCNKGWYIHHLYCMQVQQSGELIHTIN